MGVKSTQELVIFLFRSKRFPIQFLNLKKEDFLLLMFTIKQSKNLRGRILAGWMELNMSPITSADKNNIYGIKTILISLKVNCYDFDGKLNKNNHN